MAGLMNGQIVDVQAFKHDGTLYRQWNGVKVIETSPDIWVLFMYKTKVIEKTGQKWLVREPMIWWMPRNDNFYNTTGLIRKSGTHFYTNLASPPLYEEGKIKFIDYDLDIKHYPNSNIKIVDQNEYKNHIEKYNYSNKLQKILKDTSDNLIKTMKLKEGYFDEDVVERYLEELMEDKLISRKFLKEMAI